MPRRYMRDDVDCHVRGYGGESFPALNIKVRRGLQDVRFPVEEAEDVTLEWIEEHVSEQALDDLFWRVCAGELEYFEDWAQEILAGHAPVKFEQEGRSGGWLIATNLPDVEDWDAVLIAKWGKLERIARDIANGIPEQMVCSLAINEYEQWSERKRARDMEKAGLHRDPVALAGATC